MSYFIDYTDQALADIDRLERDEPSAYRKFLKLTEELQSHPTTGTRHPHQLRGDRVGQWARKITKKHRLVYTINDTEVLVLVLTAYGHFDDKSLLAIVTMKQILDFQLSECAQIGESYALLRLRPMRGEMPHIEPGQFVQVEVPNSKTTYLRRPISVNYADKRELWLLVRRAGAGTSALCDLMAGARVNVLLPLGHGFSTDIRGRALLVGGGVGIAPLRMLGRRLMTQGTEVHFLLGARTSTDVLQLDLFRQTAETHVATEDGSLGHQGLVTEHPILQEEWNHIACCGPMPMMKAVAAIARERDINCEVSLENVMACGLGACLCCVEDTHDSGNVCVCQEGPVFNIKRLKW